jgi:hypothetical protein
VWHGKRKLEISDLKLLALLALHPVAGIRTVTFADVLRGPDTKSTTFALS